MIEHPRILNRPHLGRYAAGPLGAGANMVWTPDPRTHVELLSLQIVLTTAPGGGARMMYLTIGGVADDDFSMIAPIIHAGGVTRTYWFGRGMGSFWTAAADDYWVGSLPKGLLFQSAQQLRSDIIGLLAGDVIDHYAIRYQAWQDPVIL